MPEPVKQRLQRYTELLEEIDNQSERLMRLEASMTAPRSPNMDGMPRAGHGTDQIGAAIARKEAVEVSLKETVAEADREYWQLERAVKQLRKAQERMVLRLRYFDRCTWTDITDVLFGRRPDYDDKLESYTRRAQRIHGAALMSLEKIFQENPQI